MVGEVDELEEDVGRSITCLEGVMDVEEGKLEEELADKAGTTIGTKFSVLHCARKPFSMRCGFGPVIHSYECPWSSQSFPSDNTAGVSSRTFIVKNISNSLASSCVCTSPLAVMTVVGLLDVVKESISAEFKSFMLITRIDAPESTTNSLSSGLRVDGPGRHLFSEGEKNAALFFFLHLGCVWPASTLLHGHIALAIQSLPETDPQILERWGYADEDHLGKSFQAKDSGLEC